MTPPFINSINNRVTWGECDPAGIVFYPNYFRMFNMATDELFSAAGFALNVLMVNFDIVGYPMIDTRAVFILPNKFGDMLTITSYISKWGKSSFEVKHEISNSHGLSVKGFEKRVWAYMTEDGTLKGRPVPDAVKTKLAAVT